MRKSVPQRLKSFATVSLISSLSIFSATTARADSCTEASSAVSQAIVTAASPQVPLLFKEYPAYSLESLKPSPFASKPILSPVAKLQGFVSFSEHAPDPSDTIQHLTDVAVARDRQRDLLLERAKFHNKKWSRLIGRSKGMLQYATSYQGFESSSEAADVILEEKLKLKSGAAVEFVRQKRMDAAHLQLTCAVMEIATGLGLSDDTKREQTIQSGMQEMIPLVGEDEANRCLKAMSAWAKQVKIPDDDFSKDSWDVLSVRQKSRQLLATSLENDDVVKTIETRLHKYNHHSNFMRATSKFVNTTLSLVAFSPTMASPAAQAAQFVFVACTGGPEEKKLLKEVYLDRCFESRFERLSQESTVAVNNFNNALLTRNAVLGACSQALIRGLTTPEFSTELTSASTTTPNQLSAHKAFGQRI